MRTSYQYRLKPNKEQAAKIDNTLEMLRYQYNYQLAQRFDWYDKNRCSIDRCPLVCHVPELSENLIVLVSKPDLSNSKKNVLGTKLFTVKYYKKFLKKLKLLLTDGLKVIVTARNLEDQDLKVLDNIKLSLIHNSSNILQ